MGGSLPPISPCHLGSSCVVGLSQWVKLNCPSAVTGSSCACSESVSSLSCRHVVWNCCGYPVSLRKFSQLRSGADTSEQRTKIKRNLVLDNSLGCGNTHTHTHNPCGVHLISVNWAHCSPLFPENIWIRFPSPCNIKVCCYLEHVQPKTHEPSAMETWRWDEANANSQITQKTRKERSPKKNAKSQIITAPGPMFPLPRL